MTAKVDSARRDGLFSVRDAAGQMLNQTTSRQGKAQIMTEPGNNATPLPNGADDRRKAKFEVYGEEMIEKEVKQSGNSGRVYLPPEWVGKNVKIIRID